MGIGLKTLVWQEVLYNIYSTANYGIPILNSDPPLSPISFFNLPMAFFVIIHNRLYFLEQIRLKNWTKYRDFPYTTSPLVPSEFP